MMENVKSDAKEGMEKAIQALQKQLSNVRTGKAQVSMLDNVKVDYYGSPTPLSQVAALSCPDAKSFLIAPWETSLLKDIETTIVKSDLGMAPMNDGKVIRLKLPDLTEDRRKDLAKQVGKIVEDARIAIRMHRRDANEAYKKAQKDKQMSEDESKKAQEDIQKVTDDYIKKVDEIGANKEKELMTI